MRIKKLIFAALNSSLSTTLCFNAVLLSACSAAPDDDFASASGASTGFEYYTIEAKYVGEGSYEENIDQLAEPYKTRVKDQLDLYLAQSFDSQSVGQAVAGPMYRAYSDGPKVVQYTEYKKLIVDTASYEISNVMIGRRLAQTDSFIDDGSVESSECIQAKLCNVSDGVRHEFANFALGQGAALGLGEPVSEVFYRPYSDPEQSAINPQTQVEYVLAQYFDFGRLEYRNGQVQLAKLGYQLWLEDEVNKDPEMGYMDSGFYSINGNTFASGYPLFVARTSESGFSQTISDLIKSPSVAFGLSMLTIGAAVTSVPLPDPVTKAGGPSLMVVGAIIVVGGLVGGTIYLVGRSLRDGAFAAATAANDTTFLPGSDGSTGGVYAGSREAAAAVAVDLAEARFAVEKLDDWPHVCMAWNSTTDRNVGGNNLLADYFTRLTNAGGEESWIFGDPEQGMLFAFGFGLSEIDARQNAINNLRTLRQRLTIGSVQDLLGIPWEQNVECFTPIH
ncbi:MAG: hypothetical protein IPJ88_06615 [Myxococcales bacterium]|nr:MAG: hypothetical protein IPJ88_06615 [Myxococcales bacterium]